MPVRFARLTVGRPWVAGVLACSLLALVLGCGPDYKARGEVKGRSKARRAHEHGEDESSRTERRTSLRAGMQPQR